MPATIGSTKNCCDRLSPRPKRPRFHTCCYNFNPYFRKERLMYLEHFQLERQPFSEHAAMAALWQDGRMAEGLARLEYLVAHGVLGLVTGPTGVGKSALLKQFLHGLAAQHCEAVYCHPRHLPSAALLN